MWHRGCRKCNYWGVCRHMSTCRLCTEQGEGIPRPQSAHGFWGSVTVDKMWVLMCMLWKLPIFSFVKMLTHDMQRITEKKQTSRWNRISKFIITSVTLSSHICLWSCSKTHANLRMESKRIGKKSVRDFPAQTKHTVWTSSRVARVDLCWRWIWGKKQLLLTD